MLKRSESPPFKVEHRSKSSKLAMFGMFGLRFLPKYLNLNVILWRQNKILLLGVPFIIPANFLPRIVKTNQRLVSKA